MCRRNQCDKAIAYFNAIVKKGSEAPDRYKTQAEKQIKTLEADTGKICGDRRSDESDDAISDGEQPKAES